MPQLTREARLTEVDLSVEDQSETKPPADIDIEGRVHTEVLSTALGKLPEGHSTSIIVDRHSYADTLTDRL